MDYPSTGVGFTREEFREARRALKSGQDSHCKMSALVAALYAKHHYIHRAGIDSSRGFDVDSKRFACIAIHLRAARFRRVHGKLPSTSRFHLRTFP